jgi:aspartyl/glutamyl-tRNA(Asn/Gln) amidotransferase C subunit
MQRIAWQFLTKMLPFCRGLSFDKQIMLSNKELDKICSLAKIEIEDSKRDLFLEKLNMVFDWIKQLSAINVDSIDINNVENMISTPERADIKSLGNIRDEILSNTKNKKLEMFCVPKVVE